MLAAFDQVPWELHDNSVILGCLSFFVALVMLYDLADPIARHVTDTTQTDTEYTMPQQQQNQQQPPQSQQQIASASGGDQSSQSQSTQTNPGNQANQANQTKLSTAAAAAAAGGQTNEAMQNDMPDNSVHRSAEPKIEKVVTQMRTVQTAMVADPASPDDIAQNGNYHRGDAIDFVQYQQVPRPEQPVFERVLLPEKKRPIYNKVADSAHKATIVQNIRTDYIPRETHFDSTVSHSHMPNYAAVQRQQQPPQQQQQQHHSLHQSPHIQQQHLHQNLEYSTSTSYAPPSPMYKLTHETHNYDEHNDYEHPPSKRPTAVNDYGRPPSSHFTKSIRSNERVHSSVGPERYQQQQPMMVIRNYGHSRPMRTPTTSPAAASPIASVSAVHAQMIEPRRYSTHTNNNVNHHRNGNNGNRRPGNQFNQMDSRKNGSGSGGGGGGCCGTSNANDEIDFRKYFSPQSLSHAHTHIHLEKRMSHLSLIRSLY